jgi:hypothetical protein
MSRSAALPTKYLATNIRWSPGFDPLGQANVALNTRRKGVLRARRSTSTQGIELHYRGPRDLFPPEPIDQQGAGNHNNT